ncbi:hypothetical protein Slala05_84560 [Streptomyces lavendulae subsp. lavendulae]|nr:hypothetical protein Slala05_84560 [Streptomyces lavendulae subsp. lavendulae]
MSTPVSVSDDTPVAPFNRIQRFVATETVQTFVVPPGVTSVNARCWGSGGSSTYGSPSAPGGGGGFASGDITVEPGDELAVVVGSTKFGGGATNVWNGDGRGGGMSGLYSKRLDCVLLVAGGGGGGAVGYAGAGLPGLYAAGGAAGGETGSPGQTKSLDGRTGTAAAGGRGGTGRRRG